LGGDGKIGGAVMKKTSIKMKSFEQKRAPTGKREKKRGHGVSNLKSEREVTKKGLLT